MGVMFLEFFESIPFFNKIALTFFILTKLCGLIGFAMGFGSGIIRTLGGCVLGSAFFFLVCAIVCCLLQSSQENKKFEEEDGVVKNIQKLKQQQLLLEEHVKEFKNQQALLQKLQTKLE